TISIGVAAVPNVGDNPETILKAADEALYRAKAGGCNRVELAMAVGEPVPARKTVGVVSRRSVNSANEARDDAWRERDVARVMAADD
ncbi:MAG: diguanylate cyclase domain-containing protein, partial [Stellaceae bacterium]